MRRRKKRKIDDIVDRDKAVLNGGEGRKEERESLTAPERTKRASRSTRDPAPNGA